MYSHASGTCCGNLSILIFTEIYINWDLNYALLLYFDSFFWGGGGESSFFIPSFGTSMTEKYKAGQSSVK